MIAIPLLFASLAAPSALPVLPVLPVLPTGADSDGDGLSDFHERHKHGTDPRAADSDGDGVPDGDWLERREYAYTVRAVVQVMKPVTLDELRDDFQDVRLLDETAEHVELEVVLYPLNDVDAAIGSDDGWRDPDPALEPWLAPGPTSDWTPELRRRLLRELGADGVDVGRLGDREVVERASDWLLRHAEHHDGFTSFVTSFDERGEPYVDETLRRYAEDRAREAGLPLAELWEREVSAAGMFEHGVRGSCTSSAIYLSGCLRAIGVPTRTVLCIPLVDANDPRERELLEGLQHHRVRAIAMDAAAAGVGMWTSHTFNEVWVDGRWRRLNYARLGQGVLDADFLGLMIHVGTFRDWADARMPETVGRRQALGEHGDLFGGPNPYSTISLRDGFGVHAEVANPPLAERVAVVEALYWTDDPALPEDVRASCERSGRFGLIAVVTGVDGLAAWSRFLRRADRRVRLEADGRPTLAVELVSGCAWLKRDGIHTYLPLGPEVRRDLAPGVVYAARAANEHDGHRIELDLPVTPR